ncbi:peptide-binding protein [Rhodococcus sp. 14-2483-1-1]|uniref:DUF3662 and FHA domain-containing protein n=1 Tax=Rhodococcus sp. 14-2483-1-1 TaxID=2023148 RepID=UPI000B9AEE98|nr:DUF3662 and FHA domain-containing protein [Rhodococcus sp. 14-2483-1-1]OZF37804.1 peptide-binding protein [Rhodococcus sp. 14-2483-1-1]
MGIVQRFERKLQGAVGDVFARVFGGGVVPAEVEAALQQEASDLVRPLDGGHYLAPNSYVITINSSDHDELAGDRELTVKAFSRHLDDYIRDQGWQTYGDVVVRFEPSPTLHTGQFRASGSVDPDVGRSATAARNPSAQHGASAEQNVSAQQNVSAKPARSPVPSATQRPSAPPMSIPGAGHMTQNPGYDPQRDPADGHRPDPRARNGYAGGQDPRYAAREQNGYDAQAYAPADYDPRYDQQQPYNGQGYDGQQYAEQGQAYSAAGGQDQGYDPHAYGNANGQDQGYDAQGYNSQGYDAQGYDAQGYDAQGYQYNGADGGAYSESPYQEQAYSDPAGQYAEPQAAGYQQPGYQQPAYDYPPAPAAYGRGYPQGAGDRNDGYGYDQPAAYAGQAQALAATLQLEDGSGRYFQLRDGQNIIGRGQDAQFRLPDTGVSRRHIEIRWDGRVAMLSDLGSTNGTTVNGAPVQDWQLADGDVIRAGHSEILVRIV